MSPIDPTVETALRRALAEHAAQVPPPLDTYRGMQHRATRMRRRRTGMLSVATVAVVAAAAVGVPLGLSGRDHDSITPGQSGVPTAPSVAAPTATPSSTPPSTPSSTPPSAPADALDWAFRGDGAVRSTLLADAQATFADAHPGFTLAPLWAGTTPQGGWSGLIFRATAAGQDARLGVWIAQADGSAGSLVRDDVLEAGTTEIDQQLPADPSNALVVLGAPDTKQIGYAPTVDGNFQSQRVTDGVAVFGLDASGVGNGVAYVELHDTSGTLTYRASLSAGGFLAGENVPPTSVRELVMNGLLQAWLADDRAAAAKYATAEAVQQMFAIPRSLHYVGGDCTDGATPATCYPNGRDISTQPGLLVTMDGGASAGYQVTKVTMGSE
jgi:hypothetical protein